MKTSGAENIWEKCLPAGWGTFNMHSMTPDCYKTLGRLVGSPGWRETVPPSWRTYSKEQEKMLHLCLVGIASKTKYPPRSTVVTFSDPPGYTYRVWESLRLRRVDIVVGFVRPGTIIFLDDIIVEYIHAIGRIAIYNIAVQGKLLLPTAIMDTIPLRYRPKEPISPLWLLGPPGAKGLGFAVDDYLGLVFGRTVAEQIGYSQQYSVYYSKISYIKLTMIPGVVAVDEFGDTLKSSLLEHTELGDTVKRQIEDILRHQL